MRHFASHNLLPAASLAVLLAGCLQTAADADAAPRLTLTIREAHGIDRAHVAVSSGVPFARGQLRSVERLSVDGSNGTALPGQLDVLARWDDGSVKWVLVSTVLPKLKARGEVRVVLVEELSEPKEKAPAITERDDGVQITYPGVSVKTNALGLPESIRVSEIKRQELVGGESRLLLDGTAVSPGKAKVLDVRVEESGPVRTVVRTEGEIKLRGGKAFTYVSRNTIFVNGQISTAYTVINRQLDGFNGYGVMLPLADGFRQAAVQSHNGSVHEAGLGSEPCGVRQTTLKTAQFYGPTLGEKTPPDRYHGGVRLMGEAGTLGAAIQDFWERYPSEIAITGDEIKLWFYPPAERPVELYRVGRAAGGEFTLMAGPNAATVSLEQLSRTDLHGYASPEWYLESGVLGRYAIDDFELDSGTYDGRLDELMGFLQKRKFKINEFGFWDFGDGRGADSAFRRNNEYGISFAMLFEYLRRGDSRFFEEGIAFAEHFRDVDTLHYGEEKGKSIRHTDHHVKGSGYDTAHQWVEGILLDYLLTGDRRSLEVARQMAIPLLEWAHESSEILKTKPRVIPMTERNLGWTLISLMFLEEVTGDTQYADAIKALVAGVIASQDQERGHWPRSLPHPDFPTGGSTFMVGVLTESLMRYHEKTGDPAVARSLVRASYWLSEEMWNPVEKNLRYKQWDRFWDHYNNGRTIPLILPGMIYAEHLGREDERYRTIVDQTLEVYSRMCADLDEHGEGRHFKSLGMLSRSMPRFFYYYGRARGRPAGR